MTRSYAIALTVGVLLLVCGCAGYRREKRDLPPPDAAQRQTAKVAVPIPSRPVRAGPRLQEHGFAILDFRAVRDNYQQVSVIGEIKNVDFTARGVELQASLRNAAGRLIAVGHFCPTPYRNILPDEVWPFTHSFGRQEDAAAAEIRIIGSFRTMDNLSVAATIP